MQNAKEDDVVWYASLDTALLLERKAFNLLFASQDQKEGARAFLVKRPPRYTGE